VPSVTSLKYIPTDYFRNIFFYADVYLYKDIIADGHINVITILTSEHDVSALKYYSKISHRSRVPIFAVSLVIFNYVTGLPPSTFYAHFPMFLFTFSIFSFIGYKFTDSIEIGSIIGVIAVFAPASQPIYSFNFNGALFVVFVSCIYLSKRLLERSISNYASVVVVVGSLFLFFWYPPRAIILVITLFSILLVALTARLINSSSQTLRGHRSLANLGIIGIVVCSFIVWIPIPTFFDLLPPVIVNFIELNFSLLSDSSSHTPRLLSTSGYSWYFALLLLILGAVGGFVTIKNVITGEERNHTDIVLVGWGVAVVLVIIAYTFTGTGWLISRAFGQSRFLLTFAAGVGLFFFDRVDREKVYLAFVILLLFTAPLTYSLRANTAVSDIATFNSEADEYGSWGAKHLDGIVLGDQKQGAPLVANQYLSYRYPQSNKDINSTFYTTNRTAFEEVVCSYEAQYYVQSVEQKTTGLYVLSRHRVPMSEESYEMKRSYSLVYNNGEHEIHNIGRLCQT